MILPDSRATPVLAQVRFVLVGTTHPGNIGASARAMKAMGVHDLRLVRPLAFPSAVATAQAAGADDVLAAAGIHDRLEEALAGCTLVWGTTARGRRLGWPTQGPREAAAEIARGARAGPVAVVFGTERTGLSNAELDLCQRAICIPTVADFSSLNLGQAVQIVAYELAQTTPAAVPGAPRRGRPKSGEQAATAAELAELEAHCLAVMAAVEYYDPDRPKLILRRLRRLLGRAQLLHSEVQILRGFLRAIEEGLAGGKAGPQ